MVARKLVERRKSSFELSSRTTFYGGKKALNSHSSPACWYLRRCRRCRPLRDPLDTIESPAHGRRFRQRIQRPVRRLRATAQRPVADHNGGIVACIYIVQRTPVFVEDAV